MSRYVGRSRLVGRRRAPRSPNTVPLKHTYVAVIKNERTILDKPVYGNKTTQMIYPVPRKMETEDRTDNKLGIGHGNPISQTRFDAERKTQCRRKLDFTGLGN